MGCASWEQVLAVSRSSKAASVAASAENAFCLLACLRLAQATAMKLASDRQELEAMLEQAGARLAAGQPPTDDTEAEWQRQQQQAATVKELQEQRDQVGARALR
jgi:hypothetical protein